MTQYEQHDLLQTLVSSPSIGLVTDMDGTLSHIVDQPDTARVTSRNLQLLQELNAHLDLVAVVSGRAVNDVANRVGVSSLTYIGNHGMEHLEDGKVVVPQAILSYRSNLESAIQTLQSRLVDGMWIEDKQTTLSIHYRNCKNPSHIASSFKATVEQVAQKNRLEAFSGRMIFEIRPAVEINKGVAFEKLIRAHNLGAALYLGDDTTDVDAFIKAKQLRDNEQCYSLAIGVASNDMPLSVNENSDLLVDGVSGVEEFLSWLLSAVTAS